MIWVQFLVKSLNCLVIFSCSIGLIRRELWKTRIDDQCKPNSIHQISLQLVSTGLIGTLNQIDQFKIEHILLKCSGLKTLFPDSTKAHILSSCSILTFSLLSLKLSSCGFNHLSETSLHSSIPDSVRRQTTRNLSRLED